MSRCTAERAIVGVACALALALATSPASAAPVAVSARVSVLAPRAYAARVAKAWAAISDKTDERQLDAFIHRYPTSPLSVVALKLRYELARVANTIGGWNRFISAHPRRVISYQAIHQVYLLYRKVDRISGYLDFIKRYPNAPHAVVAKARLEALSFELCTKLKKISAFDDFIATFSDAPQVPAAARIARALMEAAERKTPRKRREQRAGELFSQYAATLSSAGSKLSLARYHQLERLKHVLWRVYSGTRATNQLSTATVMATKLDQIKKKLGEIKATLVKNQRNLIATLKREFRSTRRAMEKGFLLLHRDQRAMRALLHRGFKAVTASMQVLHKDLRRIDRRLRAMHVTLANVQNLVAEGNRRLAKLDASLGRINGNLVRINSSIGRLRHDVNANARRQLQATRKLTKEVKFGFNRQFKLSRKHLAVSTQILRTNGKILATGRKQLAVSKKSLRVSLKQLTEQRKLRAQQAEQHIQSLGMLKQIKKGQDAGFRTINNTLGKGFSDMRAGFANVVKNQWATTKVLNKSIAGLGTKIAKAQSSGGSGGGGGSFFGKLLGTAAKFIPGGSYIAPAVESVTNGLIKGDSLGKIAKSALIKTADSVLPGSGQIVGALAQMHKQGSQDALLNATAAFADGYGVPATAFLKAANAPPGQLGQQLGQALAQNGVPQQALAFAASHL